MCGVTTGGREDCFWDCQISNYLVFTNGPVISTPECLLDCFEEVSKKCIINFLDHRLRLIDLLDWGSIGSSPRNIIGPRFKEKHLKAMVGLVS